ncbi:hypothetical protein [Arthrobacter sp. CAL618]|uniref:hypothetical protein n=1 Tax=Arthrobacter sp. CAL618 TaxID=1055770 RepID=UPI0004054CA8|nr:hypothetical protein [Arthrobacter sp. CAL618]
MSDQERTPRDSESDPAQSGAEEHQSEPIHVAEPQLVDPDTVQLSDAEVSPETVEPELSVSADDVQLVEPSLNPARISEDTARAASLEEIAAEARRVEQEALDAGLLVAGAVPTADPTTKAAPAGTAPAGGAAGDTTDGDPEAAADSTDGNPDAVDEPHDAEPADAPEDAGDTKDTAIPDTEDGGDTGIPEDTGYTDAPDAPKDTKDTASTDSTDSTGEAAALASTDTTRALPNFAADGDAPEWTPAATDEQRWDRLFETTGPASDASPAVGIDSDTDLEADADIPSPVPAAATASTDPAALPAGMGAAPPTSPGTPAAQTGPQGSYPEQPSESPTEPTGGPYGLPPAGTRRRDGRQAASNGKNKRGLLIGGALLGLLALGLLIWGLVALITGLTASPEREPISNGTPGADGIIAENVLPLDLEEGQCLRDFVDINSTSTVVTCSTPHNAQLLASDFYADDAEFPGDDALALRAQQVCDGVDLDETAAARYENLELLRVTPREGAWSDGDRRVDCLVTSDEGNVISDTLINN